MRLSDEEKRMLQGEVGHPLQKAMELQVALGELFEAEEMTRISSVHISGGGVVSATKAGASYVEQLAKEGARFVANATLNPGAADLSFWKEMGISEEGFTEEKAFCDAYGKMGAMCRSCSPYDIGNIPRFGEHVAWGETSAVVFANSVLGARTNPVGPPAAIAAALTGREPLSGYHLDQNRYGTSRVLVSASLSDGADYGALGFFAGPKAHGGVPVFVGMPSYTSWDQLKALGAGLTSASSVTLFHAVGITPEARTEQQAFGPKMPSESYDIEFGTAELRSTLERLSAANHEEVNMVIIGCPHASIYEIRRVAELVAGRRVHASSGLWLFTSVVMNAYAKRAGYQQAIESAGGRIVCEMCPGTSWKNLFNNLGYRTLATNSARWAHGLPRGMGVEFHYGSLERCVEAAVQGRWAWR